MARIRLERIEKVYAGGAHAVRGLDLDVRDGELVVLLGPSGCGKSTVLRLVAGLEPLTSGAIHIGDRRVDDVPPDRRDVAMVFQDYALYRHMTVRENVGFPLRMRGIADNERRRRVEEIADLLELGPLLDTRPTRLSGGQQQRVAMGRALVRRPSAFLLDEPLSNLDVRLRTHVRGEIRRIQRELGVTTIHVTHDQVEALSLGDRVAVLREGRLEQCGAGQALYDEPATTFVAAFLGQPGMNLVRAAPDPDASALRVEGVHDTVPADAVLLDAARRRAARSGRSDLVLGIRPEDVELGGNDGPGVPGTVRTVEDLGSERVVHVETPAATVDPTAGADGSDRGVLSARAARGRATPRAGERVRVRFRPDAIRLFDHEGRAIDDP